MFFFKNYAAFLSSGRTAGIILAGVNDDVQNEVDVIRFVILRLGGQRDTAPCPGFESLCLQSEWVEYRLEVLAGWPERDDTKKNYYGNGWGVDPKGMRRKNSQGAIAFSGCLSIRLSALTERHKR
ncbi:unnamed protein product [Pylaiella littoralis]